jgi:hypothetical protein
MLRRFLSSSKSTVFAFLKSYLTEGKKVITSDRIFWSGLEADKIVLRAVVLKANMVFNK